MNNVHIILDKPPIIAIFYSRKWKLEKNRRKPIQKRSIEKKERIINAAFQLIRERGYSEVGIRDIVSRSAVSIGTFYAYYTDKNNLAIDVITYFGEKVYGDFAQDVIDSVKPDSSFEDIIYRAIGNLSNIVKANSSLHKEFEILALQNDEFAEIYHSAEKKRVEQEVYKLLNHFNLLERVHDKEAAVIMVHRTVDEIVKYFLFYSSDIEKNRIFREAAIMITKYLKE